MKIVRISSFQPDLQETEFFPKFKKFRGPKFFLDPFKRETE